MPGRGPTAPAGCAGTDDLLLGEVSDRLALAKNRNRNWCLRRNRNQSGREVWIVLGSRFHWDESSRNVRVFTLGRHQSSGDIRIVKERGHYWPTLKPSFLALAIAALRFPLGFAFCQAVGLKACVAGFGVEAAGAAADGCRGGGWRGFSVLATHGIVDVEAHSQRLHLLARERLIEFHRDVVL